MKDKICYAVIGTGRAAELHINAIKSGCESDVCLKYAFSNIKKDANEFAKKYDFAKSTVNYEEILSDPEVDVVDICTPPFLHVEMAKKALLAGKHVICEKPLTGCFDAKLSKEGMLKNVLSEMASLKKVIDKSGKLFMYAENFIYAPAVRKAKELIIKNNSKILLAKGEESLNGSSSIDAGEWSKTGGGSLIRVGIHPLSAIIYLKDVEAKARGEKLEITKVVSDFSSVIKTLKANDKKHLRATPKDVEDIGVLSLSFSDNSKAIIISSDTLLGGSKNYLEFYCNNMVINANLTMSNLMSTFLAEDNNKVYISEMLQSNSGWNNVALEDEYIRGYIDEMKDFVNCIRHNKKPESDFDLAYKTIQTIYRAYSNKE